MERREPIEINSEMFPTKKALRQRVQSILALYEDYIQLNMFDQAFMEALLERHPHAEHKIGEGVGFIYVARNPIYPSEKNRGFRIVRVDGTETDFSYLKCITPPSNVQRVRSAFRAAIEGFTFSFRREFFDRQPDGIGICPETNEPITFHSSHVDHKAPFTFSRLVSVFMEEAGIDYDTVMLEGVGEDNNYQTHLADKDLELRWCEFHQLNAQLEVVSQQTNLSVRRRTKLITPTGS